MVFAFHHSPMATSASVGVIKSAAPCAIARATSKPSHFEYRRAADDGKAKVADIISSL
jgi:hypothetical protein